jgi:hypothetical protein
MGQWLRPHRGPSTRLSKYAYALNALGEVICPGCGLHMPIRVGGTQPLIYCSDRCKQRVFLQGGRLTRSAVREIIAAMA